MAGLVPAIHALLGSQDVDARHKAGHDGEIEANEMEKPYGLLGAAQGGGCVGSNRATTDAVKMWSVKLLVASFE